MVYGPVESSLYCNKFIKNNCAFNEKYENIIFLTSKFRTIQNANPHIPYFEQNRCTDIFRLDNAVHVQW